MKMSDDKITIFLSHKMSGMSNADVIRIRTKAIKTLKEKGYINIRVIDNFHHYDAPENAGRLWHLGKSIQQMERADMIYFCDGWWKAKGCLVERFIAFIYKIKVIR